MALGKYRKSGVPFISPRISWRELNSMRRSIKSTWLVYGSNAKLLEERLKEYFGVSDAVLTSSCTSALQLSLLMSGIQRGDEVITTPLSWVATANVIVERGASVIFCDVNMSTGLIDETKIRDLITPRTKAILVVDIFGQMNNMVFLRELCDQFGLILIEDSAHSFEAQRDGFSPGQLSDYCALSFHAAKNITSGQGGALLVNSKEKGTLARILRRDGVVNLENGSRRMINFGGKYDGTDFQAALVLAQLKRVHQKSKKRKILYDYYMKEFSRLGIHFPVVLENSIHAHHLFVVWLNPEIRDRVRELMNHYGISTSIHYDPIHLEPYYTNTFGYKVGMFPVSEKLGLGTISLPTYPNLSRLARQRVVHEFLRALQQAEKESKDNGAS
jgi:dTDP-4-amino-4,6-dideoxygalactose transaminase